MARIRPLILVCLLLLPLFGAQAQNVPPQFALALGDLSNRLNHPITLNDLDAWNYEQNLYTDTTFGCPYVTGEPRPNGISAFTFTFGYKGKNYDYRVAADGSLTFPCDASLPQGSQPTPMATNCPVGYDGYLTPKLEVGGGARIGTGGTPNRLRDQPSINGTQIGLIQPGATVTVIAGPTCEDQSKIIWWRVDDNGTQGWTAEGQLPNNYFLSPSAVTLPAERDLITPDTADSLAPLTTISLAGVSSISIPQDEKQIALGGLSGLAVYNLSDFSLNPLLGDISAPVTAVAFSPDRRYLAYATQGGKLIVADTTTGTRTTLTQISGSRINSLAFIPSDAGYNLIMGSGSPTSAAANWEEFALPNGSSLSKMPTASWVRGVAFSPDAAQFAWLDTALHVVQVNGAAVASFISAQPGNGSLAWRPTPAGSLITHQIAFTDGARVRLENLDAKVEQIYEDDPSFVPGVISFNRDGSLLAAMSIATNAATGSLINLFDVATSDLITSTPLQASSTLTFSPDGTLLVVASFDEVVFLGIDTSQLPVG